LPEAHSNYSDSTPKNQLLLAENPELRGQQKSPHLPQTWIRGAASPDFKCMDEIMRTVYPRDEEMPDGDFGYPVPSRTW
jgi:hypothetical protein